MALEEVSKCGLFVLPSYTEGFPNVIVEAMLLKKPIIATTVGAIPEILSENCGMLIKPKSSNDLFESLKFLIENTANRKYYACLLYTSVKYWPQYSVVGRNNKFINSIFDSQKFNIVFTGNIGEAQGLEIVINSAKELKNTNIIFHLVGDCLLYTSRCV